MHGDSGGLFSDWPAFVASWHLLPCFVNIPTIWGMGSILRAFIVGFGQCCVPSDVVIWMENDTPSSVASLADIHPFLLPLLWAQDVFIYADVLGHP